jgi:hypothetical protein
MPVFHRTAIAAVGTAAAATVAAAVVLVPHSGVQHYQAAGAVSAATRLARPSAVRGSFLAPRHTVRTIASTVPPTGDVNPYGTAVITRTSGRLTAGDVLISNYNDKANLQGTGSTIIEISPSGHRTLFARITTAMLPASCPGGVGLSTALAVLPGGWVVVGSAPSTNGQASTAKAGCLIVLGNQGRVREVFAGAAIDGPWDATAVSQGAFADLFVTNALRGTAAGHGKVVRQGTVVRIAFLLSAVTPPTPLGVTTIATGFPEQASSTAFVLGPTGVALGRNGILYVADTASNTISAIPNALTRQGSTGTGRTITSGRALAQPLGLAIAPDGDILTVNGGNGKIVETTPGGRQVGTEFLDTSGSPAGAGALFGLAIAPRGGVYYVDDVANTLRLLR